MATKSKKRKHFVPPVPKGYPLTPHPSGKFCKFISSERRVLYFGNWGRVVQGKMTRLPGDGRQEALAQYQAYISDPNSGKAIDTVKPDQVTIGDLCNAYRTAKYTKMQAGRLASSTYNEYKGICDKLVACFGVNRIVADLTPQDFQVLLASLSKGRGLVSLGGLIGKTKAVFRYGMENDLIVGRVKFGTEFVKPARSELRKEKAKGGKKLFTREEVLTLLDGKEDAKGKFIPGATCQLRCMVMLGVLNGLGNADVAELRLSHLDLKNGWLTFPRGKTGIERHSKLPDVLVAELKKVIESRPTPKNKRDEDLVFITKYGAPWVRNSESWVKDANGDRVLQSVCNVNAVAAQFLKLLRSHKINGRKGLGFYSLRHTFRTVADASKDFPACRLIMGHVDSSMDGIYREQIEDNRLEAVAMYVHGWLFGKAGEV